MNIRSCCLITAIYFLYLFGLNAQFGFNVKYDFNNYSSWNSNGLAGLLSDESNVFENNLVIGIDYWKRLKNKRIEFFPELFYALPISHESGNLGTIPTTLNNSKFGLNITTRVYPLDFGGDCNCPVWSKEGTLIKKGFHFIISPGLHYNFNSISQATSSSSANFLAYKIGIGAGIDIGMNNLFTISPFFLYNYFPSVSADGINGFATIMCPECDIIRLENSPNKQIQFGIRIGLRPDYE